MKIDFKNLKIICISLPSAVEKRKKIEAMAKRLQFNNWCFYDAAQYNDAVLGCAKSHINVLNNNLTDQPLLIIEDDVQETKFYSKNIEISDDLKLDALYVGYSTWATNPLRAKMSTLDNASSLKKINDLYKITNVTSAHSIIYFSEKYKKTCAENMETFLNDPKGNKHCDVVCAKLQNIFNVFATPKHFFYQDCPRNKVWTDNSIES